MSSVDLGPIGNFPVDQLCRVEVEKRALVVVRKEEAVYALRDICPHQGARLSGGHLTGRVLPCQPGAEICIEDAREIVVCPWHGWEFDVGTGRSLVDPQKTRVRSYAARIEDGRVVVDMER
ncbi:MAG: nitrite reductase/ring-hydroxylating ferredoxin subunit [Candidatus Latescibacterota bacterium]|jgi:nitrite reductase/ring-hydroxylating ferredoxin subunit